MTTPHQEPMTRERFIEQVTSPLIDEHVSYDLQDHDAVQRAEIARLAARVQDAETERSEAVRRYEAAEIRINDLQARVQEVERANDMLQGCLMEERKRLAESKDRYDTLFAASQVQVDEMARVTEELAEAQATVATLVQRDVHNQEREVRWQECYQEFADLANGKNRRYSQVHATTLLETQNKLKQQVTQLREAIMWALGYCSFRPREIKEGPYWWRKELRSRAFPEGLTEQEICAYQHALRETEGAIKITSEL